MSTHAVLGPSGADRWGVCPGSVALSAGVPDRGSAAADEGTAYHMLSAHCIQQGVNATEFIGQDIVIWQRPESDDDGAVFGSEWATMSQSVPPPDERRRFTIDKENAAFAQQYIDYVRASAQDNVLYVEQSLPIDHLTDEENASGTGDCIIINGLQKELTIIDLKFGRGVEVTAKENPQLMMYALGAMEKFGDMFDFTRFKLCIHQPRSGDGAPQEWECDLETLQAFANKIKRAASSVWAAIDLYNMFMEAGQPLPQQWIDGNLFVTEKGCKFCRAQAKCPKIAEMTADVTGVNFEAPSAAGFDDLNNDDQLEDALAGPQLGDEFMEPDDPTATLETQERPEGGVGSPMLQSTPVDVYVDRGVPLRKQWTLSQKMDAVPIIESWLKAVRAEVERHLLAGEEIDGYKLVKGKQGNRDWTSEDTVELMLKSFRLKNEDKYNFKLKSPTQLEGLAELPVKEGAKPKKAKEGEAPKPIKTKQWIKLQELITRAEAKLSVAPATDPREAVNVKATADGFEDLGQQEESFM